MTGLAPDRAAIAGFLARAAGDAIHLVAISAERGSTTGYWFGPDSATAATWAASRNAGGDNIYWSPNPPRAGLNKKATKQDVAKICYAFVDIDPPKDGGGFDKNAAVEELQAADVPPSLIVDSGGGVQALWRLEGPPSTDVEIVNKALVERFDGDPACWNVDRVLRVPGTVNLPNAKKRATGRVPVYASLISESGSATTVAKLEKAYGGRAVPQKPAEVRPALVASPSPLADARRIAPNDPLWQKLISPPGNDRSADTFALACYMVRHGYGDKAIIQVLLDPELPISAHCLDQPDPARAAQRAVEKARAEAVSEAAVFGALGPEGRIAATPYAWPAPARIPPRRWLYGRQLLRGTVSVLVAPGATGKSALTVGMALALATGRKLLRKEVNGGPKRVWLFNLEDAREELDRSIAGAAWLHEIQPNDVSDRLFVDSGLDGEGLCTAVTTRQGFTILQPVFNAIVDELKARQIDCLIIDPFVSSHQVSENDNGAIDAVAKSWARVASVADCAILLVHHTSKMAGAEVTVDRSRGASALTNAARSVLTLNRMSPEDGKRWGIEPGEDRRYFRAYDDKNNRAPPADASDWYYLASVDLPNGEGDNWIGDNVGVAVSWQPPDATLAEMVSPDLAVTVQRLIAQGEWRESERADRWVGKAIGQALGVDPSDKAQRNYVRAVLRQLLADGTLQIEERRDGHREMRAWIVVGARSPVPTACPDRSSDETAAVSAAVRQSIPASPLGADQPPRRSGNAFRHSTTAARHGVATLEPDNVSIAETPFFRAGQKSAATNPNDGSDLI